MPERELIAWIRSRGKPVPGVVLGPGDDAALLTPTVSDQAFTIDSVMEGVHFQRGEARPFAVGWKGMARALSDLAAMGFQPRVAVVAFFLPAGLPPDYPQELYRGLEACGEEFGCPIVGGDVSSSPLSIAVTVAAIGEGSAAEAFRRSGTQVGDALLVTGELGGSLLGKHLSFRPRLAEARRLRELACVTSAMDLSDGLSSDLRELARASRVGAELYAGRLPVSAAARELAARDGKPPLWHALHDGEDYELLFTVAPQELKRLLGSWELATPLAEIGRITPPEAGIVLLHQDGTREALARGGFEHRW